MLAGQKAEFDHAPEFGVDNYVKDLKVLNDIAHQLRTRRYDSGCIRTESLKLTFRLDENGMPIDCEPYERNDAHHLIEEVSIGNRSQLHGH